MSWASSAINSPVPYGAVVGGQDIDGSIIYVGRSYYSGDLLPAKVIPEKQAAYVSHNGHEWFVQNYEVLCGDNYMWVPSGFGQVPEGAVPGGRTAEGETLYIGRSGFDGCLTPGKIHPTHQCLYVPFGGEERNFQNYETLVQRPDEDSSCCCCC